MAGTTSDPCPHRKYALWYDPTGFRGWIIGCIADPQLGNRLGESYQLGIICEGDAAAVIEHTTNTWRVQVKEEETWRWCDTDIRVVTETEARRVTEASASVVHLTGWHSCATRMYKTGGTALQPNKLGRYERVVDERVNGRAVYIHAEHQAFKIWFSSRHGKWYIGYAANVGLDIGFITLRGDDTLTLEDAIEAGHVKRAARYDVTRKQSFWEDANELRLITDAEYQSEIARAPQRVHIWDASEGGYFGYEFLSLSKQPTLLHGRPWYLEEQEEKKPTAQLADGTAGSMNGGRVDTMWWEEGSWNVGPSHLLPWGADGSLGERPIQLYDAIEKAVLADPDLGRFLLAADADGALTPCGLKSPLLFEYDHPEGADVRVLTDAQLQADSRARQVQAAKVRRRQRADDRAVYDKELHDAMASGDLDTLRHAIETFGERASEKVLVDAREMRERLKKRARKKKREADKKVEAGSDETMRTAPSALATEKDALQAEGRATEEDLHQAEEAALAAEEERQRLAELAEEEARRVAEEEVLRRRAEEAREEEEARRAEAKARHEAAEEARKVVGVRAAEGR